MDKVKDSLTDAVGRWVWLSPVVQEGLPYSKRFGQSMIRSLNGEDVCPCWRLVYVAQATDTAVRLVRPGWGDGWYPYGMFGAVRVQQAWEVAQEYTQSVIEATEAVARHEPVEVQATPKVAARLADLRQNSARGAE